MNIQISDGRSVLDFRFVIGSTTIRANRFFNKGLFVAALMSGLASLTLKCFGVFTTVPDMDSFDVPCPECPCPPGHNGPNGDWNSPFDSWCSSCGNRIQPGMPVWWVSEPSENLWVTDEPLGYQPSVGPRVSLYLNYKQRESVAGTNGTISNMGTNWHISWVSYVQDMGYDLGRGYRIQVLLGKAGLRTMVADGTTLDYYTGLKMKRLTGVNQNTIGFHLLYPSGAIDVYKLPSARPIGGWPTYFLTAKIDAAGNQLTFQYDINPDLYSAHLLAVVDADHRVTRLNYEDHQRNGSVQQDGIFCL